MEPRMNDVLLYADLLLPKHECQAVYRVLTELRHRRVTEDDGEKMIRECVTDEHFLGLLDAYLVQKK